MAKKLHPKIQELRHKIGYLPIHEFHPALRKADIDSSLLPKISDTDRTIKQYFAIFGEKDDRGTMPMKGCFTKSINERGPQSQASNKILVLNQHDQKDPLCIPSVLKEDEIGLYGEYSPDPIPSGDRLLVQIRRGTINGGSYGFNYVWDKMEYDERADAIKMYETELYEVSPVAIPSQMNTRVVRSKDGKIEDEDLEDDTEYLIRQIPRKFHLELRSLIARHISLARLQPLEQRQKALDKGKPKQRAVDYNFLIENL